MNVKDHWARQVFLGTGVAFMSVTLGACILDLSRQRLRMEDAAGDEFQETQDELGGEEPGCGDGVCDPMAGEICSSCPADCGVCECETDADCPEAGEVCVDYRCMSELDLLCTNDADDDGDGLVDCLDPDCYSNGCYADCMQEEDDASCSDGMDNDGSGQSDCDDDNCAFSPNVSVCACGDDSGRECSDAMCSNGADDDGDGDTDCDDEDCSGSTRVTVCDSENTDVLCSDGLDNNGNGFADCNDYYCLLSVWVTVCCEPGGG